ncbi:hypothetical protein KSP39_PZI001930 [Platanthera zijinensis]|uniref:DUF7032 domain-containing protein n=1 Tax=Platanthera zijinensis TaxID=2320716 RepID=A0AAP0GEH5_9ASPA
MKTAQENTASIQQASSLLSSALTSSSCLRRLPVKWHSIRSKLQRLHSSLTSATNNGDDSAHNSTLTNLIQAISASAKETELLASRCLDESYGGGALLMKSDLDVVAGKLDLYIKQLDELCASGALRNSKAMVLSKPGTGASREDMRFYVKDLFCRLRIGDMEMRATTLSAINEIIHEDDKYVRIVAVETADSSSILVNLLEFRDIRLQNQSLEAVVVVSSFESYRPMLSMAGVIPPLIRILQHGAGIPARERAAQALKQMTENGNNSWLVSSQGGVPTLLNICREEESSSYSKLINLACASLKNISSVAEIKRFMVEEGAIFVFLNLMKSKDSVLQIEAMDFLLKLTSETEDEDIKLQVLESLLTFLNPNSFCSSKLRELALRSIERFCFKSANNVKYLLNSGFPNRLIFLLKHGEILDRESALKTASRFCGVSDEVKKTMGDMGLMTELLRMLKARSFEVRETAAETLCTLMAVQKNRRRFIREEEEGVDRVLQELKTEEARSGLNKALLSVLISLTDGNDGRRRVANSSHVRNLEKLAEINSAEAIQAKKIMKRINGNKFRSIFNGIWGR